VLFSDATLTGSGHVAKLLQRLVGTVQDGWVGPRTVLAANLLTPHVLINALIAADVAYLETLRNAPKFINGWRRREAALQAAALAMDGPAMIA
jgi:lysozyme family protein